MERYSKFVFLAVLTVLVGIVCLSPAAAVLPNPDGFVDLPLSQGWYDDQLVWFTCTTTNDIKTAQAQNLTLASKLSSAIPTVAQPLYVVQNFQQGPVFSIVPTGASNAYSGLWRVYYIKWNAGVTPRAITNDAVGDPKGIPASGVTVTPTNIVVDYPVLIVGPLSIAGPTYTIPQLVSFNAIKKTAMLPYFNAFTQNFITKKVEVVRNLITDCSEAPSAALAGANFAHGLAAMCPSNSQEGWLFDPFVQVNPPGQYPILESSPSVLSWRNANQAYSPIVKGHLLIRTGASPAAIINNATTVYKLIGTGVLTPSGTLTINAQQINPPPQ